MMWLNHVFQRKYFFKKFITDCNKDISSLDIQFLKNEKCHIEM